VEKTGQGEKRPKMPRFKIVYSNYGSQFFHVGKVRQGFYQLLRPAFINILEN
jgi:hypothetical protein